MTAGGVAFDCRTCGACCDYSMLWPRFSLESEAELALIPRDLVARDGGGMRCVGHRCAALGGTLNQSVSCSIYEVRPLVCRDCLPGDAACNMARRHHGLEPLSGS